MGCNARPLNSSQINRIMEKDPYAGPRYGGTFAVDQLPAALRTRTGYIVNTAPSNHSGIHWIAVYCGDTMDEYFCSYGSDPPPEVVQALKRGFKHTHGITQGSSDLCGYYCILYLFVRCRGVSLEQFMDAFTEYPDINDCIVKLSNKISLASG